MDIYLSPQGSRETIIASRAGDVLIINGEEFDFSTLPDGASIPQGDIPSRWFAGPVERMDGVLHVPLFNPHNDHPEQWQAFPEPLIDVPDGPLDLPFNTWTETTEEPAEGGKNIVTTIHRWHQADEVKTTFVADPPAEEESEDGVDA